MDLTLNEVQEAVGGKVSGQFAFNKRVFGISVDSRAIKKGEIFFALEGKRSDGHQFIRDVIKKGASAVVFSKNAAKYKNIKYGNLIHVLDTKKALIDLASYYRGKINPFVFAVTGSNGKTTTKEILYSLLARKYRVIKNSGNLNTEIGLPLTIFRMTRRTQVLVLEMGMTGKGEIDVLVKISKPDVGIITNVGPAHLQFFPSLTEIAKAKGELVQNLLPSNRLILNRDDYFFDYFKKTAKAFVITFGIKNKCNFQAQRVKLYPFKGSEFVLKTSTEKIAIRSFLPGLHNVYNVLAAVAAANLLEKKLKAIANEIKKVKTPAMRLEKLNINGVEVINDAYNANPNSVMAALNEFGKYKTEGRKYFVFGDMLELGHRSDFFHREIGKKIATQKINFLITRGEKSALAAKTALKNKMDKTKVFFANSNEEVVNTLSLLLKRNDVVLFKGSRMMRLEEAVEMLKEKLKVKSEEFEAGS